LSWCRSTASINFPSYPQFCGQYFARVKDKDLGLAALRAYNDRHIDDPALMAQEARRTAAKGCRVVTFTHLNALRLFGGDLFDHFPRGRLTARMRHKSRGRALAATSRDGNGSPNSASR